MGTNISVAKVNISKLSKSGFFPKGTGGSPPGSENFPLSQPTAIPVIWPEPVPQLSFVPENVRTFTSFFSQFWLLFSLKLHQKALYYLMLKTPKVALILLWGRGIFFFQVTPHLTLSPMRVPSIWLRPWKSSPKASPPNQKFWEKTLAGSHPRTKFLKETPFTRSDVDQPLNK